MTDETTSETPASPPVPLEEMDANDPSLTPEMQAQIAKAQRVAELRSQEVFMKRSLGLHDCQNCDFVYDESLGETKVIGGTVPAGTAYADLPSDWRCPTCRAQKGFFKERVEEIPGFEVNQGYGFGTNAWTSGQKNLAVFGGLGLFFFIFLAGYGLS
eukprot:CAMPEP_0113298460 /NCGR_PEP_ID=MMETSP0010_2-20120614/897_1 /TAXON_ID=216773 ORGANISM="Corethron hystrix, Strain 308" /NCGR_SAMPLE_ID=MMETSP0010_2 /ASSEMBLY_ACC=CAM_ASM_000155 /LENGTH=156 /DNA_ID=CAMNT_0000151521 /DNA_START=192 /DNA_END=662 /DNA_ORIENTATION=+ /assembly_acc=CAM_ASM_000155